jgi:hypothetical protein
MNRLLEMVGVEGCADVSQNRKVFGLNPLERAMQERELALLAA